MNNLIAKLFENMPYVKKVILFGSRNTAHFNVKSDYDLCIVIDDDSMREDIICILTDFMNNQRRIIHPYIFTIDEFNKKSNMSIYKAEIIRKGKILIEK